MPLWFFFIEFRVQTSGRFFSFRPQSKCIPNWHACHRNLERWSKERKITILLTLAIQLIPFPSVSYHWTTQWDHSEIQCFRQMFHPCPHSSNTNTSLSVFFLKSWFIYLKGSYKEIERQTHIQRERRRRERCHPMLGSLPNTAARAPSSSPCG